MRSTAATSSSRPARASSTRHRRVRCSRDERCASPWTSTLNSRSRRLGGASRAWLPSGERGARRSAYVQRESERRRPEHRRALARADVDANHNDAGAVANNSPAPSTNCDRCSPSSSRPTCTSSPTPTIGRCRRCCRQTHRRRRRFGSSRCTTSPRPAPARRRTRQDARRRRARRAPPPRARAHARLDRRCRRWRRAARRGRPGRCARAARRALVVVPTTLLAQADAGVGGKTAVNVDGKKNVLGAFHPPARTILARRFLTTLDDVAVRCGRAEMLKHEMLAADGATNHDDVARSIALKLCVVRRDPRERGLRAVLKPRPHRRARASKRPRRSHTATPSVTACSRCSRCRSSHAGLSTTAAQQLKERLQSLAPLSPIDADVDAVTAALAADKKAGRFVLLSNRACPASRPRRRTAWRARSPAPCAACWRSDQQRRRLRRPGFTATVYPGRREGPVARASEATLPFIERQRRRVQRSLRDAIGVGDGAEVGRRRRRRRGGRRRHRAQCEPPRAARRPATTHPSSRARGSGRCWRTRDSACVAREARHAGAHHLHGATELGAHLVALAAPSAGPAAPEVDERRQPRLVVERHPLLPHRLQQLQRLHVAGVVAVEHAERHRIVDGERAMRDARRSAAWSARKRRTSGRRGVLGARRRR